MSKERARRRAEREAEQAEARRRRDAQRRRAQARASVVGTVADPAARAGSRVSRWWRRTYPQGDPFARGRRRRSFVVALIALLVQVVAWVVIPSWGGRAVVLALTLFLLPVIRTLLFDRR